MFILIYKLFVDYASFLNLFQATLMLATVNVNRLATYRTYLKEGSMYSITGFDVQCSVKSELLAFLLLPVD